MVTLDVAYSKLWNMFFSAAVGANDFDWYGYRNKKIEKDEEVSRWFVELDRRLHNNVNFFDSRLCGAHWHTYKKFKRNKIIMEHNLNNPDFSIWDDDRFDDVSEFFFEIETRFGFPDLHSIRSMMFEYLDMTEECALGRIVRRKHDTGEIVNNIINFKRCLLGDNPELVDFRDCRWMEAIGWDPIKIKEKLDETDITEIRRGLH